MGRWSERLATWTVLAIAAVVFVFFPLYYGPWPMKIIYLLFDAGFCFWALSLSKAPATTAAPKRGLSAQRSALIAGSPLEDLESGYGQDFDQPDYGNEFDPPVDFVELSLWELGGDD